MRPSLCFLGVRVGGLGPLLLLLSACTSTPGGSDPGSETCSLSTEVSGGASLEVVASDPATCVTFHSTGAGIWARLVAPDDQGTIELDIDVVAEGENGIYGTTVVFQDAAKSRWQATCPISITEHRLLEVEQAELGELRHYQVAGEAACADPLTPLTSGTDETVTIEHLEFRAQVTWTN